MCASKLGQDSGMHLDLTVGGGMGNCFFSLQREQAARKDRDRQDAGPSGQPAQGESLLQAQSCTLFLLAMQ